MEHKDTTPSPLSQFRHFLDGLTEVIQQATSIRSEFGFHVADDMAARLESLEAEAKTIGSLLSAQDIRLHIAGTLREMDEELGHVFEQCRQRSESVNKPGF